mgnify:CR=1 FL=1
MNILPPSDLILPYVQVPRSMVREPGQFGGHQDQDCIRGDLVIQGGIVRRMQAASGQAQAGHVVMPKLTECHVHLDKCHTISRMGEVGGDLQAAIAAQSEDRETWTTDDIRERATRGLEELIRAGCGTVRSHVDWSHGKDATSPTPAWHVLSELAQDHQGKVDLQVAPLVGADDLALPGVADEIGRLIAKSGSVLGVFVLDQPNRQAGMLAAFRVAEKYGLALDFHVDEGLDPNLDGLGMIARTAIETGFQGPVLCGHACSLMNLQGDPLKTLVETLVSSGLTIASLPTSNLYLQGRTSGTPDRRGLTRIRELRSAGVPVVIGTDNVRDAFCPLGRHDPRHTLALAALAAHLDPPFGDYFPMITTSAESALGLAPTFVDGAAIGDLLLFDATSTSDLLAGADAPQSLSDALIGELS